jgi:hypothetical protein
MFDIVLRKGDNLPKIQKTLYVNGAPQPLAGYTVKFVVTDVSGVELLNNDAEITDPNGGVVAYQWTDADSTAFTTNVGFARFVATEGSNKFTVPNNSPLTIFVTSDTASEYSYSGDPSKRPIDEVRFLLGDVDMSKSLFTDSEIEYLLTTQGNAYAAAAEGALTFSARYTDLRDKTVGPLSVRYGDVAQRWATLAKSLSSRGSKNSGAKAITTQRSTVPAFARGMNDFPGSPIPDWQNVLGTEPWC